MTKTLGINTRDGSIASQLGILTIMADPNGFVATQDANNIFKLNLEDEVFGRLQNEETNPRTVDFSEIRRCHRIRGLQRPESLILLQNFPHAPCSNLYHSTKIIQNVFQNRSS
uniref:AlNc14C405G11412 protein n=1 Tax=Albugo laibachii Nc14 TaxID=890382 RepID=F0WZ02_9STRA|nr:AlNc14C405G11412 [Albugo laibachii Nc14]|eukprot:CCA26716.1 AlNc14C405G11412 [Albugo laibachii Nc14]